MAGVERADAAICAAEIEVGREPVAKGVHPSSLPIARSGGGDTESNSNEVVGKRGNAAPPVARGVRQTIEPFGAASIASLTVVRDMAVARNARPSVRRAPVSATVISMAAWKEAHAPIFPMTGMAFDG
jgi:hypothetical protein